MSAAPTASRVEVIATVNLALAAVATASSGYEANRWHGEQAIAFSHATPHGSSQPGRPTSPTPRLRFA